MEDVFAQAQQVAAEAEELLVDAEWRAPEPQVVVEVHANGNGKQVLLDFDLMREIRAYNEVDCRAMMEIVRYLRARVQPASEFLDDLQALQTGAHPSSGLS